MFVIIVLPPNIYTVILLKGGGGGAGRISGVNFVNEFWVVDISM